MDHQRLDHEAVLRLVNGNMEALEWIQIGRRYVHEGDDLIDVDIAGGSKIAAATRACRLGALALELYTHPFFIKNMPALKYAMLRNLHNYRDSVLLENSKVPWQKQFSDWARHGWLDVCQTVGDLCAGFDNTCNETLEMRALAYADHHSENGEQV